MAVTTGVHRHAGTVRPALHGHRSLTEANLLPNPTPVTSPAAPAGDAESQDPLLAEILDLIETLRRKTELHAAFHSAPLVAAADRRDNFEALSWIDTALEDVAAAAVGISRSAEAQAS